MSRDINLLMPVTKEKALRVKKAFSESGVTDLLIYCTYRSLEEQAHLYRQSRSLATIEYKIESLRQQGFYYFAGVLKDCPPCNGPKVTNAAPGESWHNYGQAFDAVPVVKGKLCWNYEEHRSLWHYYGCLLSKENLFWAGEWTSFKEYPHAQFMANSNPLEMYDPDEVVIIMSKYKEHRENLS